MCVVVVIVAVAVVGGGGIAIAIAIGVRMLDRWIGCWDSKLRRSRRTGCDCGFGRGGAGRRVVLPFFIFIFYRELRWFGGLRVVVLWWKGWWGGCWTRYLGMYSRLVKITARI